MLCSLSMDPVLKEIDIGILAPGFWWLATGPSSRSRLRALLRLGAVQFGAAILHSDDEDSLQENLDKVLESPDFHRFRKLLAAAGAHDLDQRPLSDDSVGDPIAARLSEVLDGELVNAIRAGIQASAEMVRILSDYTRRRGLPAVQASAFDEPEERPPLWFVTSPYVSPRIAAIILKAMQADLCFLALRHAQEIRQRIPTRLAGSFAEIIVDGMRGLLRLCASYPELEVPEAVVPVSERFPIAQWTEETAAANMGFQFLALAAKSSKDEVFFPFGEPVSDDADIG